MISLNTLPKSFISLLNTLKSTLNWDCACFCMILMIRKSIRNPKILQIIYIFSLILHVSWSHSWNLRVYQNTSVNEEDFWFFFFFLNRWISKITGKFYSGVSEFWSYSQIKTVVLKLLKAKHKTSLICQKKLVY